MFLSSYFLYFFSIHSKWVSFSFANAYLLCCWLICTAIKGTTSSFTEFITIFNQWTKITSLYFVHVYLFFNKLAISLAWPSFHVQLTLSRRECRPDFWCPEHFWWEKIFGAQNISDEKRFLVPRTFLTRKDFWCPEHFWWEKVMLVIVDEWHIMLVIYDLIVTRFFDDFMIIMTPDDFW